VCAVNKVFNSKNIDEEKMLPNNYNEINVLVMIAN